MYVADNDNNRIVILGSSLQHVRTLTQHINQPVDVKLTADAVYVLCEDSPCVRVFSYAGEMLRSLISQGEDMQVDSPNHFCIDRAENIIISDWGADAIKIFSKEGTHIHTIGGREDDETGIIECPEGLALTNKLNLVAACRFKNVLQIFSC